MPYSPRATPLSRHTVGGFTGEKLSTLYLSIGRQAVTTSVPCVVVFYNSLCLLLPGARSCSLLLCINYTQEGGCTCDTRRCPTLLSLVWSFALTVLVLSETRAVRDSNAPSTNELLFAPMCDWHNLQSLSGTAAVRFISCQHKSTQYLRKNIIRSFGTNACLPDEKTCRTLSTFHFPNGLLVAGRIFRTSCSVAGPSLTLRLLHYVNNSFPSPSLNALASGSLHRARNLWG